MDYYQILGVSENASADEIKAAYHRLALECHPDRNNGDKKMEDRFKRISSAYYGLSNPCQRPEHSNFGNNDISMNIDEIIRKCREDIKLPLWMKLGINENVIKQAEMALKNGWQGCSNLSEGDTFESSITPNTCAFYRLKYNCLSNKLVLRAVSSKPQYFKIVLFDNNAQVIGMFVPTEFETHLDLVHISWKHVVFHKFNANDFPDKHNIQDSFELQNGMMICIYCENRIESVTYKLSLREIDSKMSQQLKQMDEFLIQKEMDLKELEQISKTKYGQKTRNTKTTNINLDNEWERSKHNSKCITYNGPSLTFEENIDGKLEVYRVFEEENGNNDGLFSCLFGSSVPKKRKIEPQKVDIQADRINGILKMVLNAETGIQGNLQFKEAHCFLMNPRETAVRFESKDGRKFKIWVYDNNGQLIHEERETFSHSHPHLSMISYPSKICDMPNMAVTVCLTNVDYLPFPYTVYAAHISQIIKDSSQCQSHPFLNTKGLEVSKIIQQRQEIYDKIVPL